MADKGINIQGRSNAISNDYGKQNGVKQKESDKIVIDFTRTAENSSVETKGMNPGVNLPHTAPVDGPNSVPNSMPNVAEKRGSNDCGVVPPNPEQCGVPPNPDQMEQEAFGYSFNNTPKTPQTASPNSAPGNVPDTQPDEVLKLAEPEPDEISSKRSESNRKHIDEIAEMKEQARRNEAVQGATQYSVDEQETRKKLADLEMQLNQVNTTEERNEIYIEMSILKHILISNGFGL